MMLLFYSYFFFFTIFFLLPETSKMQPIYIIVKSPEQSYISFYSLIMRKMFYFIWGDIAWLVWSFQSAFWIIRVAEKLLFECYFSNADAFLT